MRAREITEEFKERLAKRITRRALDLLDGNRDHTVVETCFRQANDETAPDWSIDLVWGFGRPLPTVMMLRYNGEIHEPDRSGYVAVEVPWGIITETRCRGLLHRHNEWSWTLSEVVAAWCDENIVSPYFISSFIPGEVSFKDAGDAAAFKLRWG